jgi:replicative DNA helicase
MLPNQRLAGIAASLRAEDFAHPWHQEVFATIRELHAAHEPYDAERVGRALLQRVGHRRADLPRILDLLQAAPIHPRPQRYAAMVLEGSIRRALAMQAILLEAGALASAQTQRPGAVHRTAVLVTGILDDAEQRWLGAGTNHGPDAASRESSPLARKLDGALGADRLLRAYPPLDHEQVRLDEAHLVAALVVRPSHLARVSAWLRPEAVTDPAWRTVYTAALHLADSGQPIDVVTVTWEIQRTSQRLGAGPDMRELRLALDAASASDPGFLSRSVASDHLRLTADRAAAALRTAATNPGLDLVDVVETGRIVTAAVLDAAAALAPVDGEARQGILGPGRERAPLSSAKPSRSLVGPVTG